MAGNYVDVPAHRIAYERDGTVGVLGVNPMTVSQMEVLNDESQSKAYNSTSYGVLMFPRLLDVAAVFFCKQDATSNQRIPQYSLDTTNGVDGTWTSLGVNSQESVSNWREGFGVVDPVVTGVKAVRFGSSYYRDDEIYAFHIYGTYQGEDDLEWWDPTLDAQIGGAYLDFAEVPRGTSLQKSVRARNNHATDTAQGVVLSSASVRSIYDARLSAIEFSDDAGVTWATSLNIGDLLALTSVPVLVRFAPALTDQVSYFAAQVRLAATAWVTP